MLKNQLNTIKQTLQNTPLVLVLLVMLSFFLSFDRVPTLELAGLSLKISTFFGVGVILCALQKLITKPGVSAKKLSPFRLLGVWIIWTALGVVWARDVTLFAKSFLPLVFLMVLSAAIVVVWEKRFLRPVLAGLFVGTVIALVFGVFQFVGNFMGLPDAVTLIRPEYSWQGFGFPRVHSFSLEPLYFAGFLILPITLLLSGLVTKNLKPRWYMFVLLMGSASMLVATLSRGGILALFLAVAVQAVVLRKQLLNLVSWRLVAFVFSGALISVALLVVAFAVFNKQGNDSDLTYGTRGVSTVISHLANTRLTANKANKDKDDSIAQRDTARLQGYDLATSTTALFVRGTGIGQYTILATEKYGATYKGEPNNLIVEQLAQGGVIGLTLLSLFFLSILRLLYRSRSNWVSVALLSYVIAILLQAQSFHGLLITHFWAALGIGLAVTVSSSTENRRGSSTASAKRLRTSD
jgi:hypothetical protein